MIYVLYVVTGLYTLLIITFIVGFRRIRLFNENHTSDTSTFTIIIPFRNEAGNLAELIRSLVNLNYDTNLFEILFVDDHSEDNSANIIREQLLNSNLNYKILNNEIKTNSPKKDAISLAVTYSKFNWIITTDADCSVPEFWLKAYNTFIISNNPKMIVAPVIYLSKNTLLDQFQLQELLSLQGVTIGSFGIGKPFLCNGANLCYSKELFFDLNGFEGNSDITSGDDIFLLEKALIIEPEYVSYLKSYDAIVTTQPQSSLAKLLNQRSRWAAKSTAYKNVFSKGVGLIVLAMNLILILIAILTIIGRISTIHLATIFIIKFFIDFALIYVSAKFMKQIICLRFYVLGALFYPFMVLATIAYTSMFDFKWKGRQYSQ